MWLINTTFATLRTSLFITIRVVFKKHNSPIVISKGNHQNVYNFYHRNEQLVKANKSKLYNQTISENQRI